MYQWGRTAQNDDDLARERDARTRSASDRSTSPTPYSATTPAPVTTTAPPPVVTTAPAAPVVITAPPPVSTGSGAGTVGQGRDAACARYVAQIDPLIQEWETAVITAETATGADQEAAIEKLRDIERRVSKVSAPQCASKAQGHLITAMTAMIDALHAVPQDATTSVTESEAYRRASELMDNFETEYNSIKASSY
jgi:hypothetical protein